MFNISLMSAWKIISKLLKKPSWIIVIILSLVVGGGWIYYETKLANYKSDLADCKMNNVEIVNANKDWEMNFNNLKIAYDKQEDALILVENELDIKDGDIAGLKVKLEQSTKNSQAQIDYLKKRYEMCNQNLIKSMEAQQEIEKGKVIDYETSDRYIDLFNDRIFR